MTTVIKTAATSQQQVREPTRELTVDELALVIGGAPSAAPKNPPVYLTMTMDHVMVSSY